MQTKFSKMEVPLESFLPRTWASTNRRGKPGKSITPAQAPTPHASEMLSLAGAQSLVARGFPVVPPRKRNLAFLALQDVANADKQIVPSAENIHNPVMQGKAVMLAESGGMTAGKAGKPYICISCAKEFPSYFALGGHRSNHKKELNKRLRRSDPMLATHWNKLEQPQPECEWCKRSFSKPQGLATHKRFCRKKKDLVEIRNQMPKVRDFDLNELPPEAFLPEEVLRLKC